MIRSIAARGFRSARAYSAASAVIVQVASAPPKPFVPLNKRNAEMDA
jgi:hypothetical protein